MESKYILCYGVNTIQGVESFAKREAEAKENVHADRIRERPGLWKVRFQESFFHRKLTFSTAKFNARYLESSMATSYAYHPVKSVTVSHCPSCPCREATICEQV